MRVLISTALTVACFVLGGAPADAGERFAVLHVADLAALLSAPGPRPAIFDANVDSTRTFVGIIPGAHLLPVSGEVLRYLPADKARALVFYCANTYCTASHEAAGQAIDAGYKRVSVLVDGIYGWRDAKQPLRKLAAAPVSMPPAEVLALQRKHQAIVVDVREGEERHEIVDQARWMPMSSVQQPDKWALFVQDLPRDKRVIFYCAVGARSKRAAEMLREEGFATDYFEGPDQWRAAGLSLKPGPAR